MSRPSKSPNFTAIEKSVLLELIESRKDVIENKQNDGKMILKKNSEWEKITDEFNASNRVNQRKCKQLKSLLEKHEGEDQIGHCKRPKRRNKTGGGPWNKTTRSMNGHQRCYF